MYDAEIYKSNNNFRSIKVSVRRRSGIQLRDSFRGSRYPLVILRISSFPTPRLSGEKAIDKIDIMKVTKNIGVLLLAIYLIFDGFLGFGLNIGPAISCSKSWRWVPAFLFSSVNREEK
jgi:hypothetical protein